MLNIAIGKSRTSLYWKNISVTWENFCARIKPTQRTEDTVAEYHAMSTAEKSRAKDKGAFVGGFLTDNRRQVQNVEYRTMITLDADYADSAFYDRFMETCPCAAVIYTTHGHTPEKPRFRIVALLSEKVTPDCYNALARLFAALFGIDHFDEASFSVNQAMFWPSTPKDGEYICTVIDKPALDPEQFLADYPDWRDCSTLPTTSREKNIRNTDGRMQEDPLAKTGVVGALCRTYTIQEAIGKFLSDKYAPSVVEGRYDYIPGEGAAGVVIYDDKFAYSHHATDPASGKLLNAFDLLRVHLFPDDDEKTSYLKMCEFAGKDELVQETMEKERQAQVREDFHKEETAQPGAYPAPASAIMWDAPIPFGKYELPPLPVEVLPHAWQNYVIAAS